MSNNKFFNRDMKSYRFNGAINPDKISAVFSSVSNMDTQEILNVVTMNQVPLSISDSNGETLIHKVLFDQNKQKNELTTHLTPRVSPKITPRVLEKSEDQPN